MAEFIDKALHIVMGLEKRTKELLDELASEGEKEEGKGDGAKGDKDLPPEKRAENKLVDEGVKASKEVLNLLKECRDKFEKFAADAAESVVDKMNVATRSELNTVKEMARAAREKVDKLEKKLKELEGKGKKKH